jgi:3,4-dihydroxy 2-butanone 4-phosphate synthase/GTP cyclohydrolase II
MTACSQAAPVVGMYPLDSIERAVTEVGAGRPVVVVDDEQRENEGDLLFAASKATPDLLGFTIRHTSGVICVAMEGPTLDRLALPPMTVVNEDRKQTAYTVSVDARTGITTGISAADRARTIGLLADSVTQASDLTRPGHVFPLRAVAGGVLKRPGHTEAAVDLARLAGMTPAGAICELVNDDGTMMRLPQLVAFARRHRLAIVSIADLIGYRLRTECGGSDGGSPPAYLGVVSDGAAANVAPLSAVHVERVAQTRLPTAHGEFTAVGYRDDGGVEHIALVAGDLGDGRDVLVRVHSECLTGDVFGSGRCDCGPQLRAGLDQVAAAGRGVVLYMRGHEGRGIGLLPKLRAYSLQDRGRDTVDANLELGLPADARDYRVAARILTDLGVRTVRLLTNNPAKTNALEEHGVAVSNRIPLEVPPTPDNLRYLRTKRDRMGHLLDIDISDRLNGDGPGDSSGAPHATGRATPAGRA